MSLVHGFSLASGFFVDFEPLLRYHEKVSSTPVVAPDARPKTGKGREGGDFGSIAGVLHDTTTHKQKKGSSKQPSTIDSRYVTDPLEVSMKMLCVPAIALVLLLSLALPATVLPAEHAFTLGYGFAALNIDKHMYRIEGGRIYDFFHASYLYERPCRYPKVSVVLEPFGAYVNRPEDGLDMGFNAGIKWYPLSAGQGFYMSPQAGMAYTTIKFKEQGTHLLFVLQATFGYRYKNFFIEDRFKHYSNGRTASPNRSVHANVVVLGMYF